MLGAIYIGLSGMNAFSKGLQTISHNVANMNTPGFKASAVNFSDVFNSGGLGSAYGGRSNGAGVRFASPTVDFRQGDLRQTGGDLDLAVEGDGFLVLSQGERTYYARTGQFGVDDEGYVALLGSSHRLNVLSAAGAASAVNIEGLRVNDPVATTRATITGQLSTDTSETSPAKVNKVTIHTADGATQVWTLTLKPSTELPVMQGKYEVTIEDGKGDPVGEPKTIQFGVGPTDGGEMTIAYETSGGGTAEVILDFNGVQRVGTNSSFEAKSDGNALGVLSKVSVTEDGQLRLTYSNQKTVDVGAVALAAFEDLQQLERVGDGLFRNTGSPGRIAASGADGVGDLVSGQIEGSNVDLAQQFGELILIQRGFQASSQVVSVSNDMIQQLFGMRGQG